MIGSLRYFQEFMSGLYGSHDAAYGTIQRPVPCKTLKTEAEELFPGFTPRRRGLQTAQTERLHSPHPRSRHPPPAVGGFKDQQCAVLNPGRSRVPQPEMVQKPGVTTKVTGGPVSSYGGQSDPFHFSNWSMVPRETDTPISSISARVTGWEGTIASVSMAARLSLRVSCFFAQCPGPAPCASPRHRRS